ncbi:MAG: hypothetical protein ACYDCL_05280 [Myxococcales bacterium]
MQRWLPSLSPADLAVLAVTLGLIFSVSRLRAAADALERLFRKR